MGAYGFAVGSVELRSAGPIAFGSEGILFLADNTSARIFAVDVADSGRESEGPFDLEDVDLRVASLLGCGPDDVLIRDLAVHPVSHGVYLSVQRGQGDVGQGVLVRIDSLDGSMAVVPLDAVLVAETTIADAPREDDERLDTTLPLGDEGEEIRVGEKTLRILRQPIRTSTITDMAYVNGNLMVAGLSNEEWSSALRSIPFPFQRSASEGTTIQIWHASHGRYETQAPIRTFVPYEIDGREYVLAAYTCTPLVTIPFSDLQPGAKVHGTTIADLGSGNQPLDMVPYRRDGHNYILINNTSLGVMKLQADNLGMYKPIDSPTVTGVAGVPYQTINDLKDVQYLARLDNSHVLMLTVKSGAKPAWTPRPPQGPLNLRTVPLP